MTYSKAGISIIKIIAFFLNFYVILLGGALMRKNPDSTIAASVICDIINLVFFHILKKKRYNHYSYKTTKLSDRTLIRTMGVTAALFPCALLEHGTTYFVLMILLFSHFIPSSRKMETILKCDQYSLINKNKEEQESKTEENLKKQ